MKKVNFHTLQSLPTPDSWIENALAIPEKEEKEQPAVIPRRSYRLIVAASLVLVSAVGIAAWLLFGRTPAPLVIAPLSTVAIDRAEPSENTPILSTEGQPTTAPTNAPSNAPTNASVDTNTDATVSAPTEPATAPAQNASTEAPTTRPDVVSTESPTEATVHPTEIAVYPTEVTAEPTEVTVEPMPTDSPWFYENQVIANIRGAIFPENGRVYCGIYDSDGNIFGDQDPYSEQHLATVLRYEERRDSYLVVYRQGEKGILPAPGYYTYRFYDEDGNIFRTDARPLR